MGKEIYYLKSIQKGYIAGVQTIDNKIKDSQIEDEDNCVKVIDKYEYDNLLEIFKTSPQAEQGFEYRLKTDLAWEKYEVPIVKEEGEE